ERRGGESGGGGDAGGERAGHDRTSVIGDFRGFPGDEMNVMDASNPGAISPLSPPLPASELRKSRRHDRFGRTFALA
ncbi:hypothetical protein, partial [Amycolatopsis mediterranei]|uniref:hypothetical protein n=1 Tax=Amycolatopsis mediterranei TaxID=33910 RepID=UPI0033348F7A